MSTCGDALPVALKQQLKGGRVNLDDPAATLALLKLNAVVGVTGVFDKTGRLASMGLQCAFCHSTVDDSFAPGIGKRLDRWANRDLNVGLIVSLAPNPHPVLRSSRRRRRHGEEGPDQLGTGPFGRSARQGGQSLPG